MNSGEKIKDVFSDLENRNSFLLIVVYFVGIIGTNFRIHDSFWSLTPVNLVFSLLMVLGAHQPWNRSFWGFIFLCFLTGFLVEVAGVHTGVIFGTYEYGSTLGPAIAGVPLTIGVNWLMLIYSTGVVANRLMEGYWKKVLFGATVMVVLDLLIEPVAMANDFWSWEGDRIPIQNYVAWFLISFCLHAGFQYKFGAVKNRAGEILIILQFLFFGLLVLSS